MRVEYEGDDMIDHFKSMVIFPKCPFCVYLKAKEYVDREYQEEEKSSEFGGRKLYRGKRGGVYYKKKGRKVYVSNFGVKIVNKKIFF